MDSRGHTAAALTILIWGTTFVSTKILLDAFTPVEILFCRFLIGFAALFLAYPRIFGLTSRREELYFAAAGLCGVTLYFLLENIALVYTLTSNVGVLVSVGPFFTAILDYHFLRGEKPGARFYVGFAIAMTGIWLIAAGGTSLGVHPLGDFLALSAALVWAAYSVLTKKIGEFGYNTVQITRRIFLYGLLFMIPVLFLFGFEPDLDRFKEYKHLANLLFLGLGASAACFATWNFAVKVLGSVQTSVYIYLVPVITAATSVAILGEQISRTAMMGIMLTLAGLFLSKRKVRSV